MTNRVDSAATPWLCLSQFRVACIGILTCKTSMRAVQIVGWVCSFTSDGVGGAESFRGVTHLDVPRHNDWLNRTERKNMTDQTTPAINEPSSTVPVEAIVSRLVCKDCGVDIGERRQGRQGGQQKFCVDCKAKKRAANKKKQNAAWDFFSQGQFCKRNKKSC